MTEINPGNAPPNCSALESDLLKNRTLIIAANRGPVTLHKDEKGELVFQRGGGGLVTALTGLVRNQDAIWIATAASETDRTFQGGPVPISDDGCTIQVEFINPDPEAYNGYYNEIANPLLWFLQHSMWDFMRSPTIGRSTWEAWNNGYVKVNQLFAEEIARKIRSTSRSPIVMLQDYHLYLTPGMLRKRFRRSRKRFSLLHFIHIPWPGPDDWGFLPPPIRDAILQGLCAVDLLGFQTRSDGLNFIRTVETYLPKARVNYRRGRILYERHYTHVHDFPISIDVDALRRLAASPEVDSHRDQLQEYARGNQLIVRVDRSEPSKNIVRGFQAFDEMLETYPEHRGKTRFLAMLAPSRMAVEEYQNYLDELMAAAGRVNVKYGNSDWEPVRVLVGDDYPRGVASLQLYNVLLVNPIADGMNLVAKEGPIVNRCDGVLILSERAGAWQQLNDGALVISPIDVYNTAEALHQALIMPEEERRTRAARMRKVIEREDIHQWLCWQLEMIAELNL